VAGGFLADDLSGMLLATDFGTAVTYNGTATIYVIFDREYTTVEVGGEVGFESSTPIVYARAADVSAATQGDSFLIENERYVADQIENDRTGMVLFRLTRRDADIDWGSVEGIATTSEDWGSVAVAATSSADWGSIA
tara:strand:- start:1039 stop:1449 length:411 start_codon:yes stop_codon:yes gene_type:complete